jgi:arginyl-tRNA synthetase
MLSLTGNTAPYMLYAYARIQGIQRKATESLKISGFASNYGSITLDPSLFVFSKPEEVVHSIIKTQNSKLSKN